MKYHMTKEYYFNNLITPIIFVGAFVFNFIKNIVPGLPSPLSTVQLAVLLIAGIILFLTVVLFPFTVLAFENLFFKVVNREKFENNKIIACAIKYKIIFIITGVIKLFYFPLAIIVGLPVGVLELRNYIKKRKSF